MRSPQLLRWLATLGAVTTVASLGCVDRGQRALDGDPRGEVAVDGLCLEWSPAELHFGMVPHSELETRSVELRGCGANAPRIMDVTLRGGAPFALLQDQKADLVGRRPFSPTPVELAFTASRPGAYEDALLITTDDPELPQITIPITAGAGRPGCPTPAPAPIPSQTIPLEILTLDGAPSSGDERPIAQWRWAVVERPENSSARVVESFHDAERPADGGSADDPTTPSALFFLDVAGRYTFELSVEDARGMLSPSPECPAISRVSVEVKPDADLHLQLTWDTPLDADQTDDDGTDVDLYLLHPHADGKWRAADYACYFHQPAPDWGEPGDARDDPTLDIDDVNGAGPENINLRAPEETAPLGGLYHIGVHYYRSIRRDETSTYGASEARVKIYLGGDLAWDDKALLRRTDDFWDIGRLEWANGQGRLNVIDRLYDHLEGVMP